MKTLIHFNSPHSGRRWAAEFAARLFALALVFGLPAWAPAQQDMDFGDAPDSMLAPGYPTLLINNGARHLVQGNNILLGTVRDPEPDGQPVPPGLGDDVNPVAGPDDEDGVIFRTALISGVPNTITVITTMGGVLQGWLDLNADSDWADPGEQIILNLPVNPGANSVTYQVGNLAPVGPTYARFRLSGQNNLGYAGLASTGEVEDYEIQLDSLKWVKPPDLTTNGVDVDNYVLLADDFLCNQTGPITDIHIWGSFKYDQETNGLSDTILTNLAFMLAIYTDVPVGPGNTNSHPGTMLWQTNFMPGQYNAGLCFHIPQGQWYHQPLPAPPGVWQRPADYNCYQYDFYLQQPFFRQTNGTIYWLALKIMNSPPAPYIFGWKTTAITNHWNDDAVWLDPTGGAMPWKELRYRDGHPYAPSSLDLAFALSTQEEQLPYDFGDAPDAVQGTGPGDYQTILADNGAYHVIVVGAPYFDDGTQTDQPDGEADGQPDATATGDDLNGAKPDDEDGIVFPTPLIAGQPGTVTIRVDDGAGGLGTGGGFVDAWIDFNADGDWTDPGEQIWSGWLGQGANVVGFGVPLAATPGPTFARFRINSAAAGLLPTGGPAQDGEVEDHLVIIEQEPQALDFGDAPDPTYPTLLASGGARHVLGGGIVLGNTVDAESNGQPSVNADGDDLNPPAGVDDEDGITFTTALITGVPATIQVSSASGGIVQGWVDWNNDGDWADPSEQIITDLNIPAGATSVRFSVPTWATNLTAYARFRISSQLGLGYSGLAQDGEVEDYLLKFESLKWLQIPEQGEEGVDVNNTQFMLADDFVCTASGPITDIHIWGSFLNDTLPPEGPGGLIFDVSIYSDVPKGVNASYSHPGQLLWTRTFTPGSYVADHVYRGLPGEWWHNPGANWIQWADKNIYQFDFYPGTNQFIQVKGTVYWLAVKYRYSGSGSFQLGWKTTPNPWNDDACYYNPGNPPIFWKDLAYAVPHPWTPDSLNLSFALSGLEQEVKDWGDAPDPPYPTLAASGGANHVIVTNFMLGTVIDAEADGQPTVSALGDDLSLSPDDEDGVTFANPMIRGSNVAVNVFLTSGLGVGALDAWVDFNGNGVWANLLPEKVFNAQPLVAGNNALGMAIPANAALGTNYARFRLSSMGGLPPSGPALNGEVEDYQILVYQRKLATNLVITKVVVTNLPPQQVVELQWNAEAGISYQVQETTTLSNSPLVWSNVPPEVVGPANTLVFTNAQFFERYYRVSVPYVSP